MVHRMIKIQTFLTIFVETFPFKIFNFIIIIILKLFKEYIQ